MFRKGITLRFAFSFDILRAGDTVVLFKPLLRGAVVCERRDGGVEAERRERPAAVRAGPSRTVIIFHPNHASTHRFFLVHCLSRIALEGEERKRTPED